MRFFATAAILAVASAIRLRGPGGPGGQGGPGGAGG